ncbi:MAG: tetratricopeptide repeat protein [Lachnospiraceae bacterium]|nr:tetratricopeptide repeat protein [Lachnospiraceae bacterium]
MNRAEVFQILGIEATKDERALKNAYREKLTVTNPEDDPEGFKRLRSAYEEACRYAKEPEDAEEEEPPRDTTPSGLWLEQAVEIYQNIRSRQDVERWRALFDDDIFLSLEEEENCREKLLHFLTEHFKLPTDVWKLLDKRLSIVKDAKALREKFPANFMHFIVGRCERGEDLEFSQFEGPEDADYDRFLEYYDRCWQALHENRTEDAHRWVQSADALGIRHPVMEVSRANVLVRQERVEEAVALLEEELVKYPKDTMVSYNFAEILWSRKDMENGGYGRRAAELYQELKTDNDSHYMANVRLTQWYYEQVQYREAKKCAEKVLAAGSDDAFMELLVKINRELEKGLEAGYRKNHDWESGLELCWCYLQDGRIARGIRLALEVKDRLPPEKEAEYNGLMAKLYVEEAEYEKAIAMTRLWEPALEAKMARNAGADREEDKKDRDRLRQAHLIRMQCCHSLGFCRGEAQDNDFFMLAIEEGKSILAGDAKDVGVLLEMAQVYMEMGEYEQSIQVCQQLIDDYQVYAAYASMLETYRRQLDAGGVVRSASQCIRYFPTFVKSYEYLAKVYLDLNRRDDFESVVEDAEKNGVGSVLIDAYRFQMREEVMEISQLNEKLKEFRRSYFKHVEEGKEEYYEKGLEVLTEYLYHYPDDFMLVERAIFHRAAHHLKEAREDFEKALYINHVNPYALNGLSFTYKYQGEYEQALVCLKKTILYMDKEMSPVVYADMGNLYALLGDADMAYQAYRQYEELAGENKSNWYGDNLAEFAMRAGRVGEAASIYERFYENNIWTRYEKLVNLYLAAGEKEKAAGVLKQWRREMGGGFRESFLDFLKSGSTAVKGKRRTVSYPAYYCCKGWWELLFGGKRGAVRAFDQMFRNGLTEKTMEGKICDAVFACILCGNEEKGKKYAAKLTEWLKKESTVGRRKYYNRQKGHLQMEFLAAYYTESIERLQELLDTEEKCEICHFCTSPLCKELEGARILLLLRAGKREEAAERLERNLLTQPWDEYMLAIGHTVFGA